MDDDLRGDDLGESTPMGSGSDQSSDQDNENQGSGQGRGFFTETEEDRKKHQKAGREGGEATARRYGDTGFYQQIGREGGEARAAKNRSKRGKKPINQSSTG